jgi:hypothetical protein
MFELDKPTRVSELIYPQSIAVCALVGLFSILLWRRFLAPISDIPGPKWASLTRLWHMYQIWTGHQNLTILELHEKHGEYEFASASGIPAHTCLIRPVRSHCAQRSQHDASRGHQEIDTHSTTQGAHNYPNLFDDIVLIYVLGSLV